jgi:NitT/TauT family transport system ATP-binding protein
MTPERLSRPTSSFTTDARPNTTQYPVIELVGVSKVFGAGRDAVRALSSIDLKIESGTFVSVVGPSGCGKSTLLRLMAGLEKPTAGELRRYGQPLNGPSPEVGIVFQDHVLFPWASVLDNVLLPAEVIGLPKAPAHERALWLLRLTG